MDASETAKLFTYALDKIQFYWNFYVGTILVLIGWLISTKASVSNATKALVVTGYLVFAAMNVFGLWGAYGLAEALKDDLIGQLSATTHTKCPVEDEQVVGSRAEAMPNTLCALKDMRQFEAMRWLAIFIHVIGVTMLFVILSRPAKTSLSGI